MVQYLCLHCKSHFIAQPKAYPQTVKAEVKQLIDEGKNDAHIRSKLNISHRTLHRWRSNLRRFNQMDFPMTATPGRPRVLGREAEEALYNFLQERPDACYSDMQWFLYDCFAITVDPRTVRRSFERRKWSRKALKAQAIQQSEFARTAWLDRLRQYHADQLVFVDESASNRCTNDQKFGFSLLEAPHAAQEGQEAAPKRDQRWSLLPAYTLSNGYLPGYFTCQGIVTEEMFIEWLRDHVLAQCTPFPGQRSVLVMDTATIHRRQTIQDMCESCGVRLEYLPPHSPDFNPVEASFDDIRNAIKTNKEEHELYPDFGLFLRSVIDREVARGLKAKMHFKNACVMR